MGLGGAFFVVEKIVCSFPLSHPVFPSLLRLSVSPSLTLPLFIPFFSPPLHLSVPVSVSLPLSLFPPRSHPPYPLASRPLFFSVMEGFQESLRACVKKTKACPWHP